MLVGGSSICWNISLCLRGEFVLRDCAESCKAFLGILQRFEQPHPEQKVQSFLSSTCIGDNRFGLLDSQFLRGS